MYWFICDLLYFSVLFSENKYDDDDGQRTEPDVVEPVYSSTEKQALYGCRKAMKRTVSTMITSQMRYNFEWGWMVVSLIQRLNPLLPCSPCTARHIVTRLTDAQRIFVREKGNSWKSRRRRRRGNGVWVSPSHQGGIWEGQWPLRKKSIFWSQNGVFWWILRF